MANSYLHSMGSVLWFPTMGTEVILPRGYDYEIVHHREYNSWRCDYCNAVNDIKYHQCKMCAADKPRSYDK